ncbi:hypothetical protein MSPP1_003968 [Malassezia sp. CBS 17886]|nr:hypothetical protein MSPP1_003968 [Malassezia sp. CBS 17886]
MTRTKRGRVMYTEEDVECIVALLAATPSPWNVSEVARRLAHDRPWHTYMSYQSFLQSHMHGRLRLAQRALQAEPRARALVLATGVARDASMHSVDELLSEELARGRKRTANQVPLDGRSAESEEVESAGEVSADEVSADEVSADEESADEESEEVESEEVESEEEEVDEDVLMAFEMARADARAGRSRRPAQGAPAEEPLRDGSEAHAPRAAATVHRETPGIGADIEAPATPSAGFPHPAPSARVTHADALLLIDRLHGLLVAEAWQAPDDSDYRAIATSPAAAPSASFWVALARGTHRSVASWRGYFHASKDKLWRAVFDRHLLRITPLPEAARGADEVDSSTAAKTRAVRADAPVASSPLSRRSASLGPLAETARVASGSPRRGVVRMDAVPEMRELGQVHGGEERGKSAAEGVSTASRGVSVPGEADVGASAGPGDPGDPAGPPERPTSATAPNPLETASAARSPVGAAASTWSPTLLGPTAAAAGAPAPAPECGAEAEPPVSPASANAPIHAASSVAAHDAPSRDSHTSDSTAGPSDAKGAAGAGAGLFGKSETPRASGPHTAPLRGISASTSPARRALSVARTATPAATPPSAHEPQQRGPRTEMPPARSLRWRRAMAREHRDVETPTKDARSAQRALRSEPSALPQPWLLADDDDSLSERSSGGGTRTNPSPSVAAQQRARAQYEARVWSICDEFGFASPAQLALFMVPARGSPTACAARIRRYLGALAAHYGTSVGVLKEVLRVQEGSMDRLVRVMDIREGEGDEDKGRGGRKSGESGSEDASGTRLRGGR